MSTFENKDYRWRETYFVLFPLKRRPKLEAVSKAVHALNKRYELSNPTADDNGLIESLTVISPDDNAALDICFTSGEEVLEQAAELVDDLEKYADDTGTKIPVQKIMTYDGRFDVLHFEHVSESADEEDDDMLDPSTLLIVLEALAKLTGGVAIDPQSGTMLDDGRK
jgi:hypothetical protein